VRCQELQQVDFLAQSFRRAANMSTLMAETRAHMRAGIIQENLRQLPKAVERYTKFLAWCVAALVTDAALLSTRARIEPSVSSAKPPLVRCPSRTA
jgi:prephenate dehydrogenase